MQLTNDHIDYIIKDLQYRGIVVEGIEDEMIDHICSAVEAEMKHNVRFIDAYHHVLKSFGHTSGLLATQKQILQEENHKAKNMLRNYIIIGLRNLRKQGFYSFINIAGLAIGVSACLIIMLFIIDELQYDTFNTKADRIYRVHNEIKFGGNHMHLASSSAPTAHTLLQDYPEIEAAVRFRSYGSYLVKPEDGAINIKEQNVIWTDSSFFKIFSVPVLEGNAALALKDPGCIAISRRTADKYFPNTSAIGKTLILDNKYSAKVTIVYEDIPEASHFHFDILIPMVGDWPVAKEAQSTAYMSNNFQTYILVKENTDGKGLEAKLAGFIETHVGPQIAQVLGNDFTMEKFRAAGNIYEMTLMPLLDIHLKSHQLGEFENNGNITYIYLFATIAAFILIIACINFMNMSTARSANRAKEVGVRKVMGSLRSHLIRQFLTESTLITIFSFFIALGISALLLPIFNSLALKDLHLPWSNPLFYGALLAAALVIGLMAGVYPSFFLSAFKPAHVLKGNISLGMKSGLIRSALVVFQFVISIFLIVGAITVNQQLNYIQNKNLGFEKDQVIIVQDAYALRPNVQSFKDEVLRLTSIESGSISGYLPVEGTYRNDNVFWREGNAAVAENMVSLQNWSVDVDYVKTMGMKIKKGRAFSSDFPSDSSAVILNEAGVIQFGLGDDPIGKKISHFSGQKPDGSPDPSQVKSWTVIGVVENFHFSSMKESISSLGLFMHSSDGFVSLRFKASNAQEVISDIEKIWKRVAPDQPFQYSFLNDDFGRMYSAEQRLGKIFGTFATLAIIIACLGLFALTAFTTEQRTKEIGIRKVLGASVSSIVMLLSREFGKLVIIAFVLASPIAWYSVNWWLQNYAYKTEIGIVVYILAGITALLIATLTISYQSIRAATSDPVKSLKNE